MAALGGAASGQDVSAPAFLQIFEARWDVVEDRMADIFVAGYDRLWLPPPAKADSGGLSVGYDVYDRFDLGSPRNETLYGTETGLKTLIQQAHTAGIRVNTDFIGNHNGFSDASTLDNQGTASTADDVTFLESGGYPGFVVRLDPADDPNGVGDIDGDFHGAFEPGEQHFRLSGLIDIAQEKNHQFIRHPVGPDPQNIPAGTTGIFGRPPANQPDPNNARFYPDQGLGGTTVFDPALNQSVTLYDFNTSDPLEGDAVSENATGLLIRNIRWMIQEVGVDGFRYDAVRHYPAWVQDFFDQGEFLAKQETLLDGSPDHVFSFQETGFDSPAFIQERIRKDIDNGDLSRLGGNRDALDFNLFGAVKGNLTSNGLQNDWRNVKNASIDGNDDGLANNGTQGVAFVQSHDDGPSELNNVAHAYMLMRPGNALVYFNADQFDHPQRAFPEGGRGDALGGMFGDAVTTLVNLRNTYGRGNYLDRTPAADEKELLIYERENAALVVLNNRGDSGYDQRTVQTGFAPGTPLVELTGNAENPVVDPLDELPSVVVVDGAGQITIRSPRNQSQAFDGLGDPILDDMENPTFTTHGSGYVIYGVAPPQGELKVTDASGAELTTVLPGHTPTPGEGGPMGPSDNTLNGVTRLTDITVVTDDSFKLRVETGAVTLAGGIRDVHADGDFAQFRIDDGRDKDGNVLADVVTPGDVAYGFTNFTDTHEPGFFNTTGPDAGHGLYEQTIDTTKLAEGRHYLTGRVYRHRDTGTNQGDPSTNGDGGPAVFSDFREVIYVDRLEPESEVVSFEPFATAPGETANRDLITRSTDKTADNMHIFLDLPAGVSDAEVLQMALGGSNDAGEYDRDRWIYGFFGVSHGNHVATVVTFEPTGRSSVRRFAGLFTETTAGAGFGDLDADGLFEAADLSGPGGFEQVLYSQNDEFNAAADLDGDGLVDTRDLLALGDALVGAGAGAAVLAEYEAALLRRGDINQDGQTDQADLAAIYANLGSADFLSDINTDGVTDADDARALVVDLVRSTPGDFNLDGRVDAADYTLWRDAEATGSLMGDADFNGIVDVFDHAVWSAAYGFERQPLPMPSTAVPAPAASVVALVGVAFAAIRRVA